MYDENYGVTAPMTINICSGAYKFDDSANKIHK